MKKMIPAALCMVSLAAASLTGCSLNSETAQNLADEVTANTSAVHSASDRHHHRIFRHRQQQK